MNEQARSWDPLITGPDAESKLRAVMGQVTCGLSDITGRMISHDPPRVERVPIVRLAMRAGGPETEVVGVHMQIEGGLRGRATLILPLASALSLVDLIMNEPPGKTTAVGPTEGSALAEAGNLTASYFLNAVSSLDGMPEWLQPSPPAVVVDKLDAILDLIVKPAVTKGDDLLIVETVFWDIRKTVQARFWVLPDLSNQGELQEPGNKSARVSPATSLGLC